MVVARGEYEYKVDKLLLMPWSGKASARDSVHVRTRCGRSGWIGACDCPEGLPPMIEPTNADSSTGKSRNRLSSAAVMARASPRSSCHSAPSHRSMAIGGA